MVEESSPLLKLKEGNLTTKLTTTTEKATTWEDRFDDKYSDFFYLDDYGEDCLIDEGMQNLKSFIASELQRQRESIVEEIKKLKRIDKSVGDYEWTKNIGYNDAIDDIIKKVEEV